jgi:hypothetical protein
MTAAKRYGIKDTATQPEKAARMERFIQYLNRRGYNFVKINNVIEMRDGSKYIHTKTGALLHVVDELEPKRNYAA